MKHGGQSDVQNDMNLSPQPSPTRGEGVNSRVDFSLPEKVDCHASLAMTYQIVP
ncbi:hypothetical protein J6E39_03015 [bacterium]|nr:hypothetical protein [bacterium]